jgi:hypothetical protein
MSDQASLTPAQRLEAALANAAASMQDDQGQGRQVDNPTQAFLAAQAAQLGVSPQGGQQQGQQQQVQADQAQGQQQQGQQQQGQVPAGQQQQQGDSWLDQLPPQAADEIRRLRQESAGYRTERNSLSERIQNLERSQMTDDDRRKAESEDLQKDRVKLWQLEAVLAEGLPQEAVPLLAGSTKDEIAQSARTLKQFAAGQGQGSGQQVRFDGGAVQNGHGAVGDDMNGLIRAAAGRT